MTDELFIARLDKLITHYRGFFKATVDVAANKRDRDYYEGILQGLRLARDEFNKETP